MDELSGEAKRLNAKSDVDAKQAFCEYLIARGFTGAAVTSAPTDVVATRDGVLWRFEIKFTRQEHHYFGAATLGEWAAAAEDPDHFRFVVAYRRGAEWNFDEWTPEEFMGVSYVPPFKIFFNVPVGGTANVKRPGLSKRINLTKARLRLMTHQFEELSALEE